MIVKTTTLAILAPDYLLPELSVILESAPETREALTSGALTLSADAESIHADRIVVIAPTLKRFLDWMHSQGETWPTSLSATSYQLARLAHAAARPNATVIEEEYLHARPGQALQTIAESAGLRRRAASGMEAGATDSNFGRTELPLDVQPIQNYSTLPVPRGASTWWPYYVFRSHNGQCPPLIDITGRPRILFCGPHIALTAGRWRADIAFDLSKDATLHDYLVEFGTTGNFSRILFRPQNPGQQMISLEHIARNNSPVEVRIELLRAAFHGEFKLSGSWITKLD